MMKIRTNIRIAGAMLLAIGYGHVHASSGQAHAPSPPTLGREALIVTVPETKPIPSGGGFEYTVNTFAPQGTDAEILYETIWKNVFSACSAHDGFVEHYTHDRTNAPSGTIHSAAAEGAFALCKLTPPVTSGTPAPVEIVIARDLTEGPFLHRIAARGNLIDTYKLVREKAYAKCMRYGLRVQTASFTHWPLEHGIQEVNVDFACDDAAPLYSHGPHDDTTHG